ncbi:hypothetical protein K491DRAFT_776895 [Lophiostoma macrostomum CBS 122681]|uniref:BTB domain-containing protein n=1 Tax=Lophiostoma macrostomum CBS 122681 TaxID=1314788 RepID=A0A6A6TCS8_9PLEO|nr:hypothetical protein K491DRAFT_776895 [Lophiostoma macrostomum CBS 122681]
MQQIEDPRVEKDRVVSAFHTAILKVIVGEDGDQQKTFLVHEGVICLRSKFFHNALNGEWIESTERAVKSPDDAPAVFEHYLQLLYAGSIPILGQDRQFDDLTKVYVLAEKLMDIRSKNKIVSAMLARSKVNFPFMSAVAALYSGTPESSPARRLYVDVCASSGNLTADAFGISAKTLPHEFHIDLGRVMLSQRHLFKSNIEKSHERPEEYMEKEEQEGVSSNN